MTKRPYLIMTVMAVCLLVGFALKGMRYSSNGDVLKAAPSVDLSAFLAPFGWQPVPEGQGQIESAYKVLSYANAACSNKLNFVVLGQHDGLIPLLRMAYGSDLAFVQNGRVVSKPNLPRFHFESAIQTVALVTGFSSAPVAPILAISPAPTSSGERCLPPTQETWRRFGRNWFKVETGFKTSLSDN